MLIKNVSLHLVLLVLVENRPRCSKIETHCKGPHKRAEPRARRVRSNSVVGEMLAGTWQGNDDCPAQPLTLPSRVPFVSNEHENAKYEKKLI